MKTKVKTDRERRFYMVLPIIAVPFLTLLFWILGGGTSASGQKDQNALAVLNTNLPDAGKTEVSGNKLSYYEIAEKDSAKLAELMRMDSNYRFSSDDSARIFGGGPNRYFSGSTSNHMTERIYQNLNNLERQMHQGYAQSPRQWENYAYADDGPDRHHRPSSYRQDNDEQGSVRDPEIDQLNQMLDKIMEIQNPELASERLRETSEKRRGHVFAVTTPNKGKNITLLDRKDSTEGNTGFFDMDQNGFATIAQNAIRAVVHEDQVVVNGSTVKMRLIDPVLVNGVKVPKDNFIFGTAQLTGERLTVKITSLRFGNYLYPIDLSVIDLDGLDGIYIPGSITRDVLKQSADRPLQSVNLGTLDGSWGGQAAGAGVEMIKGLFSKKAKLVKVKIKAGYQILLRDEKQKNAGGF